MHNGSGNPVTGDQPEKRIGKREKALKSRIVVIEKVYHQPPDGEATGVDRAYTRWVDSTEEPYGRKLTINPENWKKLDHGWVKGPCMVSIFNEEGRNRQTIPTPEELQETAGKIIEIGIMPKDGNGFYLDPFIIVRPGESCRFETPDISDLWIRCVETCKSPVKVTIFLVEN